MSKELKESHEFKLGEVVIYIVESGIDIEFPDEDSPFTDAVSSVSLEKADSIRLAESILRFYKD